MADRLDRAKADLEERTGVLATIRAKPLAAVGLAFSAGFVAAAVTARDHDNWAIERARRQLRRMILSGVTAALAHELRGFLGGDEGLGTLLASFLDDDDEYDLEA